MNALAEQREVVRCERCSLNQFMTASALCRRCHKSIAPVPEPTPAPLVIVSAPVIPREDFSHIGATLRDIRLQRHLHQRQLAARMGVPRSYVSKIENAVATPTVASLDRFAKALGVDISVLLGGVTIDPFIAEIAPYVAQLDDRQRSIFLNTVRQLAAQGA